MSDKKSSNEKKDNKPERNRDSDSDSDFSVDDSSGKKQHRDGCVDIAKRTRLVGVLDNLGFNKVSSDHYCGFNVSYGKYDIVVTLREDGDYDIEGLPDGSLYDNLTDMLDRARDDADSDTESERNWRLEKVQTKMKRCCDDDNFFVRQSMEDFGLDIDSDYSPSVSLSDSDEDDLDEDNNDKKPAAK
jgi:hypothetical protein